MEENNESRFLKNLTRNNKEIRRDRAIAIAEDASLMYKREVEDLEVKLKGLYRDQENMLDQSPTDTRTLKVASDFDAKEFADKHILLGVEIHNITVQLRIAKEQYGELFGDGDNIAGEVSDRTEAEPELATS